MCSDMIRDMKKRVTIWLLALMMAFGFCTVSAAGADGDEAQPDYPSIVSITPGTNGFTLKWSAYPEAIKYRLFVRNNGKWLKIGDTASTSMNHLGLADETAYTYTVRALDSAGRYMSLYSVPGWTKTYRAAPQITSVAASGDALKIRWAAVPDVTCYRLYKRVGGSWQGIAFVDGTAYTDEDVVSGGTYTYTVRGVNDAHTEFLSAYSAAGRSGRFVAVPMITSAESIDGVVRLKWTASAGAAKYRVFYKNGTGWKGIGDTASTVFSDTLRVPCVTRIYTVRALDSSGKYISDFSRAGYAHRYLEAPRLTSADNAAGGQKISWQSVPGADRYRIYRKTTGAWSRIADTDSLSYLATDLENDTTYTYTVRCVSADGTSLESGFDRTGVTAHYIAAPAVTSFTNLPSGALVIWEAPEEIARYRLFVRADGTWKKLCDVKGNCGLHPDAEDGVSYTYTVRAIDKDGRYISGYYYPGFTNTYYAPPAITDIAPSEGAAALSWEPRESASGYRVYRCAFGGEWEILSDVTEPSYLDDSAPADIPCQYSLCCLDADGAEMSAYLTDLPYYVGGTLAQGRIAVSGHTLTFADGACVGGYVSAQDIIRIAEAEVGTKATYWKRCKYNTWYYGFEVSGDGYDWCAVFVNWVFNEAGASDLLGTTAANCGMMGTDFKQKGMLVTSDYQPGDVVLFHWDDDPSYYLPGFKSLDHVGIIISVNDDGSYTTVEGNTGPSRDGEVMIQTRYDSQISCGGRPAYGFVSTGKKRSAVAATGAGQDLPVPDVPAGGEYRLREAEITKK